MRRLALALCFLLLVSGCARPTAQQEPAVPPAPPEAVPVQPTPTPTPQPAAAAAVPAGFTTGITGGGDPAVQTTVEGVTIEASPGGGVQVSIRFGHGIPVWAAHTNGHGHNLWLEVGAIPNPNLNPQVTSDAISWSLNSSRADSWLEFNSRLVAFYKAETKDDTLVLTIHNGAEESANPSVPTDKAQLVDDFMKARIAGADSLQYLGPVARLQYARLSAFQALRYKVRLQGGEWPATGLYGVHLENDQSFTDELLYVTVEQGKPVISMLLGHPPVPLPQQPDEKAAYAVATQYLDAWAKRDRDTQFQLLAPSEQKGMTQEQKMLLGGLSNPHPFRAEIHQWRRLAPGCYQFDVLRSEEYTGEGELGRGLAPLYVTQQEDRYGILLQGRCGG